MNVSVNETDRQLDFDYYDFFLEWDERQRKFDFAYAVFLLASVVFGTIFNIIAVVVMIRRRLWKQHEGYLYLLAIFIGNIVAIIVVYLHKSLSIFHVQFRLEHASDFICKMYLFLYHVFYSTAWYTSALLLNAFIHDRLANNTGCWHRLASKYCTVVGSLVVNGFLTSFFVIMNCWALWSAKVEVFTGIFKSVEVSESYCRFPESGYRWIEVSNYIMGFAPLCFVVPVLWVLAVWTRLRHGTRFALISGQDDHNDEAKVFVRLSTIVGAAVFLLQFPAAVVEMYMTSSHSIYYQFIEVVMLIYTTHIVVVPLCFLAGGKQMRDELRLLFTCICCSRNKTANDRYRILPLEPIENPSTETIAPD